MTRFLIPLIAALLIAQPSLAAGFLFDLPDLTFPQPKAPVTQSTSGQVPPPPAQD